MTGDDAEELAVEQALALVGGRNRARNRADDQAGDQVPRNQNRSEHQDRREHQDPTPHPTPPVPVSPTRTSSGTARGP
ncbi:hypothetical protein SMICM17S_07634 [Streptomyces microflavus]